MRRTLERVGVGSVPCSARAAEGAGGDCRNPVGEIATWFGLVPVGRPVAPRAASCLVRWWYGARVGFLRSKSKGSVSARAQLIRLQDSKIFVESVNYGPDRSPHSTCLVRVVLGDGQPESESHMSV